MMGPQPKFLANKVFKKELKKNFKWTLNTNPFSGGEDNLGLGPLKCKSSALTTSHAASTSHFGNEMVKNPLVVTQSSWARHLTCHEMVKKNLCTFWKE